MDEDPICLNSNAPPFEHSWIVSPLMRRGNDGEPGRRFELIRLMHWSRPEMRDIRKPALVRRFYDLSVEYAGRLLSYNKMLGLLDDAGNTTTLAEYLSVLGQVGFMTGPEKFDPAGPDTVPTTR